jgi:hypothetical protein
LLPTITSAFQIAEVYIIIYAIMAIQILELYALGAFEAILRAKQPQRIGYGFLIFEACKVIAGYILIMQFRLSLLGVVTSVIIAYALQLTFYLKLTGHQLRGKIRWDYVKEWLKASPINLYNLAGQRLVAFILIFLFIYGGQLARAYYGAANTIAHIIGYSSFLAYALYPRLLSKSDPQDVSTSLKLVFMFMIPMTAGAITLSNSYLTILKKAYRPATPVLTLLAVNTLCTTLSSVFGTIVSGTEKLDAKAKIPFRELIRSRLFLTFTLPYVQAAATIPLAYFTLRSIAETAIEAATFVVSINLATNLAILLANYAIAKKCIDFSMPWSKTAKYASASAIMTIVLIALPTPTKLSLTLALTFLGGIIYLAVLLPIDKETRDLVRDIMKETLRTARLQRQY